MPLLSVPVRVPGPRRGVFLHSAPSLFSHGSPLLISKRLLASPAITAPAPSNASLELRRSLGAPLAGIDHHLLPDGSYK
jgi:hypothetical protein